MLLSPMATTQPPHLRKKASPFEKRESSSAPAFTAQGAPFAPIRVSGVQPHLKFLIASILMACSLETVDHSSSEFGKNEDRQSCNPESGSDLGLRNSDCYRAVACFKQILGLSSLRNPEQVYSTCVQGFAPPLIGKHDPAREAEEAALRNCSDKYNNLLEHLRRQSCRIETAGEFFTRTVSVQSCLDANEPMR